MFDLVAYDQKTVQFANMLFGDHSRTFDLQRLELFRLLNVINSSCNDIYNSNDNCIDGNCTGDNCTDDNDNDNDNCDCDVHVYVSKATEIIGEIKKYIKYIKLNDTFSFYTTDDEMFKAMESYLSNIEYKLINNFCM